jgi:H+/Cl- antiporter ClcA
MHSLAIFCGFLIAVYGCYTLRYGILIVSFMENDHSPNAPFSERWGQQIIAALMLPIPVIIALGGGALLLWAFVGH